MAQDLEDNTGSKSNEQEQEAPKKKVEKSRTPLLDVFGTDLTKLAREGKLESAIGREKEILRITEILLRKKKNNPIITGLAGTGKSSIIYGLAKLIAEKKANRFLQDKKIFELDITSIVAGTKFRGEFEQKMKLILNEIIDMKGSVILFVDEVHSIIGSGNAENGLDIANILKPALARGDLSLIGATTQEEAKRTIFKSKALARRFQEVMIEPSSISEAQEILKHSIKSYEDFHNVKFTKESLDLSVVLAEKYITSRCLPDSCFDVIDTCAAQVKIKNSSETPKEIIDIEEKLIKIEILKESSVKKQLYEEAAKHRNVQKELERKLEAEKVKWHEQAKNEPPLITEKDIYKVVSDITKIPLEKISEKETKRLLQLPEILSKAIIGQEEAVGKVSEVIQIKKSGMDDSNKPASFLFMGGSGVGKTSLVKALANELFFKEGGDLGEKNIIRLDMSEYSLPSDITRIIGSSAGFVGYEDVCVVDKIKQTPFSILLLDEIEKAYHTIHKLFLGCLDEGHITSATGEKINCKNLIIIMTSNIGSKEIQNYKRVGFETTDSISDDTKSVIEKALKKALPIEFINRIDSVIYFNNLTKENVKLIVDIEVNKFINHANSEGYNVSVSDSLRDLILEEGYTPEFGARPVRRRCKENLIRPFSKYILEGKASKTKVNKMDYDKEKKEVIIK